MSFDLQFVSLAKAGILHTVGAADIQVLQLTSTQEPECGLVLGALFPHVLSLEKTK